MSDDELDRISGGAIYWNDQRKEYEIIDNHSGRTLETADDFADSLGWCYIFSVPNNVITEEELMALRRADELRAKDPDDGGFRSL